MRGGTHEKLEGRVLGGRYRCNQLLAKGGMGAVYEGVQDGLGRRIAIKVLHPLLGKDREQLIRFEREAHAAASLAHPNVVHIIDFFTDEGDLAVLVMEYIEGRSLADLILDEGPLEIGRAVGLVTQVLAALEAAHGIGIIHRDLKPGNVMVTSVPGAGEVVKLVDFGLAKMTEGTGYTRLTMTGLSIGTPIFMSPEQALGEKTVDHRTDVYAAGILLYGALTRSLPYRHDAPPAQLLKEITTGPVPSVRSVDPGLPEEIDLVVRKALAKDRNERYQSARALAQALVGWLPPQTESLVPGFVTRPSGTGLAPTNPARPATMIRTEPGFSTKELEAAGLPRASKRSRGGLLVGVGVVLAVLIGAGVYAVLSLSKGAEADTVEPEAEVAELESPPEPTPIQVGEPDVVVDDAGPGTAPEEEREPPAPRSRPSSRMRTSTRMQTSSPMTEAAAATTTSTMAEPVTPPASSPTMTTPAPRQVDDPLPPAADRTSGDDQRAIVSLHRGVASRCRPPAGEEPVTARFTIVVEGNDVRRVLFDGAVPATVRSCIEQQSASASGFDASLPARRLSLQVRLEPREPEETPPAGP